MDQNVMPKDADAFCGKEDDPSWFHTVVTVGGQRLHVQYPPGTGSTVSNV